VTECWRRQYNVTLPVKRDVCGAKIGFGEPDDSLVSGARC
jgi:hypothetical protein